MKRPSLGGKSGGHKGGLGKKMGGFSAQLGKRSGKGKGSMIQGPNCK